MAWSFSGHAFLPHEEGKVRHWAGRNFDVQIFPALQSSPGGTRWVLGGIKQAKCIDHPLRRGRGADAKEQEDEAKTADHRSSSTNEYEHRCSRSRREGGLGHWDERYRLFGRLEHLSR